MEEQWRAVVGAEGAYEVSNLGRLRSLDRTLEFYRKGKLVRREYKGEILSRPYSGKYPLAHVRYNGDTTTRTRNLHVLVANAFVPNPEGLPYVNHIDGDKQNPRADNLEWVTEKGNSEHAIEIGLMKTGEEVHNSKLTPDLVRWIRKNAATNGGSLTYVDMERQLGVDRSTCYKVVSGKTWKHVQ